MPAFHKMHPALPIFCVPLPAAVLIYVPAGKFMLASTEEAQRMESFWKAGGASPSVESLTFPGKREWLERQALETEREWIQRSHVPYAPECLTIRLGTHCILNCAYCFTRQKVEPNSAIPILPLSADLPKTIAGAAKRVAAACRDKGVPFYLVLQGSGEPTLHWEALQQLYTLARDTAAGFGVRFQSYIATNGILQPVQARWLGENFDQVGLSCDGPPEIQDRQRPFQDNKPTAVLVKRTASLIKEVGGYLSIRSTITVDTMLLQADIAEYLFGELQADSARFEPCYSPEKQPGSFKVQDAAAFAQHFLEAQRVAAGFHREISFAGVRLDEFHDSHCEISKQALYMLLKGTATACFFQAGIDGNGDHPFILGRQDTQSGEFLLDELYIRAFQQKIAQLPSECHSCINIYHCSRGCPEVCRLRLPSEETAILREKMAFRCRLHQELTMGWLKEIGTQQQLLSGSNRIVPTEETRQKWEKCCDRITEPKIHNTLIQMGRAALGYFTPDSQSMPLPPWQRFGFSWTGEEAFRQLPSRAEAVGHRHPISIYIHIPFCIQRCGFCDCHSRLWNPALEKSFLNALIREIRFWAGLSRLRDCPVTTIHWGGGTPNSMTREGFQRIVTVLRDHFTLQPQTEWALETTVGEASPDDLVFLQKLGFSRLHLGIQTLENRLRSAIGRKKTSEAAMEVINNSMRNGWITSVDLIYGLPRQSEVLESVRRIICSAVHGVSLYRFRTSSRNRAFVTRNAPWHSDEMTDFLSFLAADLMLITAGYEKNHFTHYSLAPDQNLYYRYADRKENLIAMGPTADGRFGGWHYRHAGFGTYQQTGEILGLEGALQVPQVILRADPLVASLMCGYALRSRYIEYGMEALLEHWIQAGLLTALKHGDRLPLTGAGSWFISEMLSEVERAFP